MKILEEFPDRLPPSWCRRCSTCGAEFSEAGKAMLCPRCRQARDEKPFKLRVHVWFSCAACGTKTRRRRPEQRCCSIKCSGTLGTAAWEIPVRTCPTCNTEWKPSKRSNPYAECWDCRKPGPAKRYRSVRKHYKRRLILREGGMCQDCGKTEEDVGEPLHAHHIIPQSLGGAHALENLKLLCPDCHLGSGLKRNHPQLAERIWMAA